MKALCFGSLNIDYHYKVPHFVQKGETLAAEERRQYAGGKGLNQSLALARSGAETYHAGAIGEDGLFLREMLREAGVRTDYISVLNEIPSGHAVIQNDAGGDNCILIYGGANFAIGKEMIDKVLSAFDRGDLIVLQNEINNLPYIMEKAAEKGMRIAFTPAPMREEVLHYPLEKLDYLLLNEVEAAQILGLEKLPDDYTDLAKALIKKFPALKIVLTLGAAGAVYADAGRIIPQKAYPVKAVDSTGAGDTYAGYFLGSLMTGASLEEALERASKAAALAVTKEGAAPSVPLKEALEAFEI